MSTCNAALKTYRRLSNAFQFVIYSTRAGVYEVNNGNMFMFPGEPSDGDLPKLRRSKTQILGL